MLRASDTQLARPAPQLVYIDNENVRDPRVNLAIEEYALREFDPRYTYVLFYVNEPSIIIGRNQDTLAEIDADYVREHELHVVRRRSGGGAVYHDAGNLNFSFITDYTVERLNNFRFFTEPVVRVLQEMGVDAQLQGRNDVVVDGRKVSGNAQFSTPTRMVSHGTLLFDSNLADVGQALRVRRRKLSSKGHASVRARVANIADFAERELDVPAFRQRLLRSLFARSGIRTYRLSARDRAGVERILQSRYARWAWNYGESPAFDLHRSRRFDFGELDARLDIRRGRIAGVRLHGDMLEAHALGALERSLTGVPYDPEALIEALAPLDPGLAIPGLSREALLDLIWKNDDDDADRA